MTFIQLLVFSQLYWAELRDLGSNRSRWVWTPEVFTSSCWKSLLPHLICPFSIPHFPSVHPSGYLHLSMTAFHARKRSGNRLPFSITLYYSSWLKKYKTETSQLFTLAVQPWTSLRIVARFLVQWSVTWESLVLSKNLGASLYFKAGPSSFTGTAPVYVIDQAV